MNVDYFTSKHKLFVCNSNVNSNELKFHIYSGIEIDSTNNSVNLSFKFEMNGQYSEYPVDEEE